MGDGVLSQEEINALLNGGDAQDATGGTADLEDTLTPEEVDAIGEISNISMGTAATTLFSLVNKKVEISTPVVSVATWDEIVEKYERPCVIVRISYTKGLNGSNILVLCENDVKIITDLMMGGDGSNTEGEVGEIHLSAISEAMNQMMGSSATSLSSMLDRMIDISPPSSDLIDLQEMPEGSDIDEFLSRPFVRITFRMLIGDLIDSEIMQLYPVSLAKDMCASIMSNMEMDSTSTVDDGAFAGAEEPTPAPAPAPAPAPQAPDMNMQAQQQPYQQPYPQPMMQPYPPQQQVNVQPAQFQPFAGSYQMPLQPENIDLIMDVPLEVTVELGRTHKTIQEILDFAPGTIIELNKIAGEPIDVLVNGKYVAKGEVVVIEESFGVRITEIIK
jgi:flagellar motor switch protein FliN/FliY